MKKHIFLITISLIVIIFVLFICKKEDKVVYGVKSEVSINQEKNNINDVKDVNLMNECYSYLEDYFSYELPKDKDVLEDIREKINIVVHEDIYYTAFECSDFNNHLKTDESYYKNTGFFDETFLRERYLAQLLTIKLTIDLVLEDYSSFREDFINNYNTLLIALPYYFSSYISEESEIVKNASTVSVVIETYEQILSLSQNEMDSYLILSDMYRLTSIKKLDSTKKSKISAKFHEISQKDSIIKSFDGEGFVSDGLETPNLNPEKKFVFSYEISY